MLLGSTLLIQGTPLRSLTLALGRQCWSMRIKIFNSWHAGVQGVEGFVFRVLGRKHLQSVMNPTTWA